MRLYYTLTTIDPVIVSQTNTTTNNHECLDHIPGSAILGMLAAQHYQDLSPEQSWQAFHSGSCRFSPCYPVVGEQICLPTPASWHFGKGQEAIISQQYNGAVISNHSAPDFVRDAVMQYKQCRDGYLNSAGNAANIQQGLSTKTAINRLNGRASDGQLFSYAYLNAGQTFAGFIECEDESLLTLFEISLNKIQRIGRSRNVEFGRVDLKVSDATSTFTPMPTKTLIIWCLSDCELLNMYGVPTLNPKANDIHPLLQNTHLNRSLSFIRHTKVSRFNQQRQGADSEQILIAKGSVLVFDSETPIPREVQADIAQKGIGINQQQGLGWVQVNPLWANMAKLQVHSLFEGIKLSQSERPSDVRDTQTNSALINWVKERVTLASDKFETQNEVNAALSQIYAFYRNARSYHNIINSNEAGPSSSQWRRIADKVRATNHSWTQGVFVGEQAICKAYNDELGWGISWHNRQKQTDFASEIKLLLEDKSIVFMRLLLEKLCRFDISTYRGMKDFAKEYGLEAKIAASNTDKEIQL